MAQRQIRWTAVHKDEKSSYGKAVARLFTQAYEQQGVLTNAEVSLLLKLSPSTVGSYRREWEKDHARMLPARGSIHDMGPTLTHKNIILQKLIFEPLIRNYD